jgi:hypothetical protein
MTFQKSYGGTGIMIPVKKAPHKRKKQEFGGKNRVLLKTEIKLVI